MCRPTCFKGNLFFGSEGTMALDGGGFRIYRGERRELADQAAASEARAADTGPHVENLLRAVTSRRPANLNADILEGHLSTTLCHLANISYRTGRSLIFDPATETFRNDSGANSYLSRDYRRPFIVEGQV